MNAYNALDLFLFEDVVNNQEPFGWRIAYQGDNYVLMNEETEELFHFKVTIEPHEWDSSQVVEEQEWFDA
jgi:hypothetical protein